MSSTPSASLGGAEGGWEAGDEDAPSPCSCWSSGRGGVAKARPFPDPSGPAIGSTAVLLVSGGTLPIVLSSSSWRGRAATSGRPSLPRYLFVLVQVDCVMSTF